MAALHQIRHHLLHDADSIANSLEDFVSVPAFIYQLQEDNYLSLSRAITDTMGMEKQDLSFKSFLERMHPADCAKALALYVQDVPKLMYHRQGDPPPRLRGFDFSILDQHLRWRRGIVKLDVAGYDSNGQPDKLFGIFLLDDTPIDKVEQIYEQDVREILDGTLIERINEVKAQLRTTKHYYGTNMKTDPPPVSSPYNPVKVASVDDRLIKKFYDEVEKQLSSPGLTIECLSREVGVSRSQLHRRLVALTGHSAARLVKEYRLRRAADLLRQKAGNVSEIAFRVGIETLSYFSKAFKQKFGVVPSEYRLR
jgi:AraC-like DNA-binding protein